MLYLRDITYDSFVVLEADWPVDQALQIVREMTDITHVIVHRVESEEEYYYLYTREEAQSRLKSYLAYAEPIRRAFNLHEYTATDTADAYAEAETAPDRTVVLEAGNLVGFYDVSLPPPTQGGDSKRGDGDQTTESAGPVTRSLIADFPPKVPHGQKVALKVTLSIETDPATATSPALPMVVPLSSVVDVTVHAKRGFKVIGADTASLTVLDVDETLPLVFKLEATEVGPGVVRVLANLQGNPSPLGMITLKPLVVPATEAAEAPSPTTQILASASLRQPDLALEFLESQAGGRLEIKARITATNQSLGLYLKPFDLKPLQVDLQEYFRDFFQSVDNLPLDTPEERDIATLNLAAKGLTMFNELLPQDLQTLLWDLQDRIKTVRITSDEFLIPWELCKLSGKENGQFVDGPFLCEAFSVTRWVPGYQLHQRLGLNHIAVVAPQRSGLAHVSAERDYLKSLEHNGRQVELITATLSDVTTALVSGTHDGWHFTGHGIVSGRTLDKAEIMLEGGHKLTPTNLSGAVRNLGQAKPLVFLNGCQTGQGVLGLTGISGWAPKFLQAGAAAFIGSYWSIGDLQALEFAKAFYSQLLAGVPIGEAVRIARLKVKAASPGDPTWLAYTVFADPLATVDLG